MNRVYLLLALLLLTQCVDPQSRALKALAAKGYSLSIAQFFKAASEGDVEAIHLFVLAGVAPDVKDAEGSQAMNHAARGGKPESIEALAAHGASVPAKSSTLLSDAVRSHSVATLQALLALKVRPEADTSSSPLAVAAAESQREMLEALLPLCFGHEDVALIAAAQKGDISLLSTLMRAGASVFARDAKTLRTPLMVAADQGHEKVVKMLLDAGANRWSVNAEGFIAAESAQAGLHAELAKSLLADPTDEERKTSPSIQGVALPLRVELLPTQLFVIGQRESLLPFMLTGVDEKSATLSVTDEHRVVKLEIGAPIPDTAWKLDRLKLGGAVFRKLDSNERLMLMPGVPGRYGALNALIQDDATKQLYEAAAGDTFVIESDSALHFKIKSVSTLEVVIIDDSTPAHEWTLKLGSRRW